MSDSDHQNSADSRFEDLLFAYAEDTISQAELKELEALITEGGEASREYWRQIDLHVRLQQWFDAESPLYPPEELQSLDLPQQKSVERPPDAKFSQLNKPSPAIALLGGSLERWIAELLQFFDDAFACICSKVLMERGFS